MLIYLGCSALVLFLASAALQFHGELSFLATMHLVLAGAILPLIFGAITHFMPVLTRGGEAHRAVRLLPLMLQVAGILVVLFFQGSAGLWALHAAAAMALLAGVAFSGWLLRRARRTLGKPHPGWRWYLAAIACLIGGLLLVPLMIVWPERWPSLRLLHLHLNTLGFVGLTAIGTLQVLMPTVLSGPDVEASVRLRRDLLPAVIGVALVALGAAFWRPLALFGSGLLLYVVARLGMAWLRRYGWRTIADSGAASGLAAALCGFLLLLLFGVAHGAGWMSGQHAVPAFISGFLLPLVSGALAQLLPVWCFPGRQTERREQLRKILGKGGAIRALLFVSSGILLALGQAAGLWLATAGLLPFIAVVLYGLAMAFQAPASEKLP